jgi:hypothetical protein
MKRIKYHHYKISTLLKRINYRHYIIIALLVGLCIVTVFSTQSILRLWEAVRDAATSLAYYFAEYWAILTGGTNNVTPTVATASSYIDIQAIIPVDWETFKLKMADFGKLLIDWDNFSLYAAKVGKGLSDFLMIVSLLAPVVILLFFVAKQRLLMEKDMTVRRRRKSAFYKTGMQNSSSNYKKNNVNRSVNTMSEDEAADDESKPLQLHRKLEKKLYRPVIDWLIDFVVFLHPVYTKLLFIWLLIHTNAAAIILEAFAYLFYWVVSFDTVHLYLQAYKLTIDVAYMLTTLPLIIWVIIALKIFDVCRKAGGLRRLREQENDNRKFIAKLALVIMFVGTMGLGKTTIMDSILLSQEVMFREKALEFIQSLDMKFPTFPWQTFEAYLQKEKDKHGIWSLPSIEKKIEELKARFLADPTRDNLFGYDFEQYGLEYNGELVVEDIFDVMTDYAKVYFIYSVYTSLIYSNIGVRSDNIRQSNGHFHMWDTDFFERDSRNQKEDSKYSHWLLWDSMRPSKQVVGKTAHKLGFGVYGIDEIGKERGNQLENADKSKSDKTANPKNDGFNAILKMMRHLATILGYPFIRFFSTENRASSVNADLKELMTIVSITAKSDSKLAMRGFFLEELLHDLIFQPFINLYYNYRFVRSDNTLFMYVLKRVVAAIHKYYENINNKFGYFVATLSTQPGTQDAPPEVYKFYVSKKKVYSDRFRTDSFAKMLTANDTERVGIDDTPTYKSTAATAEEFKEQGSYFVDEILKIGAAEPEEDEPAVKVALPDISDEQMTEMVDAVVAEIEPKKIVAKVVEAIVKKKVKKLLKADDADDV